MFTGIIKEVGSIKKVIKTGGGREMIIACNLAQNVETDASININGVCHTAVSVNEEAFTVQSVEETLRKTNIGELSEGSRVNLERSLHPGQLLDGHLVQGHVDTAATVKMIEKEESDHIFTISVPKEFKNLVVDRGSVTIDGISLTIAEAGEDVFRVAVIPYTFEHTVMKHRQEGDKVNIEFDILGKYVRRYLEDRGR